MCIGRALNEVMIGSVRMYAVGIVNVKDVGPVEVHTDVGVQVAGLVME